MYETRRESNAWAKAGLECYCSKVRVLFFHANEQRVEMVNLQASVKSTVMESGLDCSLGLMSERLSDIMFWCSQCAASHCEHVHNCVHCLISKKCSLIHCSLSVESVIIWVRRCHWYWVTKVTKTSPGAKVQKCQDFSNVQQETRMLKTEVVLQVTFTTPLTHLRWLGGEHNADKVSFYSFSVTLNMRLR